MWKLVVIVGAVALLHFSLAKYPPPFKKSANPKREILEALGLWALLVVATTVALFSVPEEQITSPTVGFGLVVNLLLSPFWVFIPLYVVLRLNKWRWRELGFATPRSWLVTIFALLLFGYGGLHPLFTDPGREPLSAGLIVLALYQPAFTEELLFRGIIQGKFERAVGQGRALIYTALLFGSAHTVVNFFGAQWYAHGQSVGNALGLLVIQTLSGLIFGLIYMKSRSIFPSMAAHFFTDWRLGSIVRLLTGA
jgi:membrane protease YdiL (CAAX protease family)